ncbi:DUF1206 domain-containing protein [Yinghuangia aomiensis]|uniref:DUF1206 domain-containing protein n=1 Tax=Yinghuangia aomiensis TaxID=676205 RepID=A0ABP9I2N5_9ACTN
MSDAVGTVQAAGKEVAASSWLGSLARLGLVARGVNYVLVGVLAVQIGTDAPGKEADRQGALRTVAGQPGGGVIVWAIAVGFAGLTLWRLVEVLYGRPGPDGGKATKRLTSLARAIVYGVVCGSIIAFVTGSGGDRSSDEQSKDFTARAMGHTGGRWLVLLVGIGVVVGGVVMVVNAVRRRFLKNLRLGKMSESSRVLVETFGAVGRSARGVVVGAVGVFLVAAAAAYDPRKAKGLDDTLRQTASGPLGPWPLYAIALGLVAFGVSSVCEARWRDVHPEPKTSR